MRRVGAPGYRSFSVRKGAVLGKAVSISIRSQEEKSM